MSITLYGTPKSTYVRTTHLLNLIVPSQGGQTDEEAVKEAIANSVTVIL